MEIVETECFQAIGQDCTTIWHACLGHIGAESLKTMVKKELVNGLPKLMVEHETCKSCLLGKQTRCPFRHATSYRAKQILELLHGDLCGPISRPTATRNKYIFVIIDDHSRYMWSILLKEKRLINFESLRRSWNLRQKQRSNVSEPVGVVSSHLQSSMIFVKDQE